MTLMVETGAGTVKHSFTHINTWLLTPSCHWTNSIKGVTAIGLPYDIIQKKKKKTEKNVLW